MEQACDNLPNFLQTINNWINHMILTGKPTLKPSLRPGSACKQTTHKRVYFKPKIVLV